MKTTVIIDSPRGMQSTTGPMPRGLDNGRPVLPDILITGHGSVGSCHEPFYGSF